MTFVLGNHSNGCSLQKMKTIEECVIEKLKVLMAPFLVIKLYTLLLSVYLKGVCSLFLF